MGLRSVDADPRTTGASMSSLLLRLFTIFVADVNMTELVSYLRQFRSSVATGSSGSADLDSAPILRRLDAFLSSHLGGCICVYC